MLNKKAWQAHGLKALTTVLMLLVLLNNFCSASAQPIPELLPENATTEVLTNQENCPYQSTETVFKPQTIFDESEEGITFLHRWANALHIDTKVITLENEAAFFLQKCHKNFADLAELERHLRSRSYLRDAKVTSDKNVEKVTVTTWDNWSLMPTLSFGRKGGVNTYSVGIKDHNLLGLGIDAEIESYQNTQRSGYKLVSTIPLFQKQNTDINLRFSDNDDGQQRALFLKKSFAGFHIKHAYLLGFNEESRDDTIFQNGYDQSIYTHDISYKEVNYAWLNLNTDSRLLRYRVGVTQDQHIFSSLSDSKNTVRETPLLTNQNPQDRDFIYPWAAIEYIEKDFRKATNVHLISQIEDFNHGWQVNSRLGLGNGNKENSAWALWKLHAKKGFNVTENALLLVELSLLGDVYKEQNNRILIDFSAEYFYQFNKNWGLYLSNANIISDNQYLDRPVTMGGDSGLRGFPLQYQHGKNSVKLTSEIRYYPQINIFKLFDLAGVAFFDTGRAFGGSIVENIEDNWLASAGLGIRLYSPHGNNHVVHVDFAFPQSTNPEIDNFEIRLQAKKSF